MIETTPAAIFTATAEGAPTGLVGSIGVQITDENDVSVTARSTASTTETPAGSGTYVATRTAPTEPGDYLVVWDTGGTSPVFTEEQLVVSGLPAWLPTQQDVAALMFARAHGEDDEGTPGFGTRPTPGQVEAQIAMAWLLLRPDIGTEIPARWQPVAREVVKLQTALLLEPGFWPEQQRDAIRAAWDQWKELLDRFLISLIAGLKRDRDDGASGDGEPSAPDAPLWSFPPSPGEYVPGAEMPRRYGW